MTTPISPPLSPPLSPPPLLPARTMARKGKKSHHNKKKKKKTTAKQPSFASNQSTASFESDQPSTSLTSESASESVSASTSTLTSVVASVSSLHSAINNLSLKTAKTSTTTASSSSSKSSSKLQSEPSSPPPPPPPPPAPKPPMDLFARFKDYFPAELIDLEGHVDRFFADRALFSDRYWAQLDWLVTGHQWLGPVVNSWGRYDVGERRRSVVGLGRQMVAANMLNTVFEKVLGREALSAHCYHLYAVLFCRNGLEPELTPPSISGDLAKSPEPELRQLAAELRLIEAIRYFAPQETAQLMRPLLPLSDAEVRKLDELAREAEKAAGKNKATSGSGFSSSSSSSSTWKITSIEQVLALVDEATKPFRLELISYWVALRKWVEMIPQASLGGSEALMITLPTRGLVEDHQDDEDEDEGDLAGYMKRALAGDNRPPKVRPDQRWTTAPPIWTADVQPKDGSKGGKQLAETSVSFSSSSSSPSFAVSSPVLFSFSSSSSSSSKDAKKGSAKTSDEKACFSSMKDNQMCEEKAKSEKENVFSHLNDSSSSSSVQLVFKKDPKNSGGGGGFVLDPASSPTMIGGDQEKEEEAMISTSASTSASSFSHENTKLEKTKVVPSAAADADAADAVSSKEKPAPTISTEVFNELSSFVTYVEGMLADLDAKQGSNVSISKAPAPAFPADTRSAANANLKILKTLLAAQAPNVSPSKVSAATAIASNLALGASAAASPKLDSASESFVALLADIKIAIAASVYGSSNTAPSTSSSSAATATAAAAATAAASLSSAKADPVKELPSTKTVSTKTAVAAAARREQKATEKRLGSAKYSKEQVSELFAVFEEVLNTGLLPGIPAVDQIGCAYRRWLLRQVSKKPGKPKEKVDQKENLEEEEEEEEDEKSEENSDSKELDANDYEEEEEENSEEEEEKKAKEFNDHLFNSIAKRYRAKMAAFYQRLLPLNAAPNQAREAEGGQLNLGPAVFKVLQFADATFSKVTAYVLRSIIRELCEGLSTRQEVLEEVATLLAKERAVAREEGHTERCFTEEEEALLYELLAEIPQTQMELQTTRTKETKETKENDEEEWKLGVMTWRMCESSDGAIPKNNVVFTFRPLYTAEEEVNRPEQSELLFVPFRLLKRLANTLENSL